MRRQDADGEGWVWQRYGPGGHLEETSKSHATYGKALRDAIGSGFEPAACYYSVDLPHGRVCFPPGLDPEFSPSRRQNASARWIGPERRSRKRS